MLKKSYIKELTKINKYYKIFIMRYIEFIQKKLIDCHWGILGGAARAILNHETPNDIDIIYDGRLDLSNIEYTKNPFDGYNIQLEDCSIDLWSIDSHFAFKNGFYEKKWENIHLTGLINYDMIFYDTTKDKFYDTYYQELLSSKKLVINHNKDYFKVAINMTPGKMIKKIYNLKDRYIIDEALDSAINALNDYVS